MKKNKASFKKKYYIILIVFILAIAGIWSLIQSSFLQNYYRNNKINDMKAAYEDINEAAEKYGFASDEFEKVFKSVVENNNVIMLIRDNESETIKVSTNEFEQLSFALLNYIFGQKHNSQDEALEVTDKYEIHLATEPNMEFVYIDMWGELSDGILFLMRSPMGSIVNSVNTASSILTIVIAILTVALVFSIILFIRAMTIYELRTKNQELENSIKQKEELEKMRSEFLSGVSHELKTPLAIIQGYAEGLDEFVDSDEETRKYYCDVIVDEASKMNSIVQKLMSINRLEFGEVEHIYDYFDIIELIKDYLHSSELLCKSNDVTLKMNDYTPIMVFSDAYSIREVFDNYFSNALHYVSGDKIIEIKISEEDDYITVSVFNSGVPIPEESINRLFEKFYKVDTARTREYGGSGVGLSVVKAVLDSLNEQYGVKNYAEGVEFFFTVHRKDTRVNET